MPHKAAHFLAGRHIPQARGSVLATREHKLAIRRERGTVDEADMADEAAEFLARRHIPQPCRAIIAGRDDLFAVGREVDAGYLVSVAAQDPQLFAGVRVPDAG